MQPSWAETTKNAGPARGTLTFQARRYRLREPAQLVSISSLTMTVPFQRLPGPTGYDVKVEMEHRLTRRLTIKCCHDYAIGLQRLSDSLRNFLHDHRQLRQCRGIYVEDISGPVGLGYQQYMSRGLREQVHECKNIRIFVDSDCRRLLAQYLRESVCVVINGVEAHRVPTKVATI